MGFVSLKNWFLIGSLDAEILEDVRELFHTFEVNFYD
jgi:hypothetical protein